MKAATLLTIFTLATTAACTTADDGDSFEGSAYWSESTGFVMPKESHEYFTDRAGSDALLWVVGDKVSLPLDFNPDTLETLHNGTVGAGPEAQLPDIVLPTQIAPGTRLGVHVATAGKLGPEIGSFVLTSQPEEQKYGHWASATQQQCHHACGSYHTCPWCSPCGGGCSNITGLWWDNQSWMGFNCSGTADRSPCWWGYPWHYCWITGWQIWCY